MKLIVNNDHIQQEGEVLISAVFNFIEKEKHNMSQLEIDGFDLMVELSIKAIAAT
jgi:predicted PolB exonuclease-like 3'-5' exonuclease